jgi:hypothetical protein
MRLSRSRLAGSSLERRSAYLRAAAKSLPFCVQDMSDRLWDLTDQMTLEDGVLWIQGTDERQTMAFTAFGTECGASIKVTLNELIAGQPEAKS